MTTTLVPEDYREIIEQMGRETGWAKHYRRRSPFPDHPPGFLSSIDHDAVNRDLAERMGDRKLRYADA